MRQRVSLLVHLLVVLGLTLPGGVEAALIVAGTSQTRVAAPDVLSAGADDPVLLSKRAKTRHDRRQDRRQDAAQDHKKSRKQTERKHDDTQKGSAQDSPRGAQRPVELATGRLPASAAVASGAGAQLSAEDRYIVLLEPDTTNVMGAATGIAAAIPGVVPTHVYRNVFAGFAAVIPPDQLAAVQNDPRVAAVAPDEVVYGDAQIVPTGVDRINAELHPTARINGVDGPDGSNERVDIDVAVVDTAGDDVHPDLNVLAYANCTDAGDSDDHGHGTHVGGTIGALDNGIGVVGVAPGARLWNVRVLKAVAGGGSSGLQSWIICGVDLVTLHSNDQGIGLGDIEVANLSLGGNGSDSTCQTTVFDVYHLAFCRAVAAGVTVVVAAGNETQNAATKVPAAYDEVITVSALADSNGKPGGGGPQTSAGSDDTLATFSNFGADVDIAAPGVDILSTVPTGSCPLCAASGYRALNGTSMASPHVAGVAALFLATHPGSSPAQVKADLLNTRELVALPNDPDGINEGVLRVVNEPPPPPTVDPQPPAVDTGSPPPQKDKNKKKKKGKKGKKKR